MKSPILIWPFHDAPENFRSLSPHGGDEDWLAFVPESITKYIPWIDPDLGRFGNDVSEHKVDNGTVYISAHA